MGSPSYKRANRIFKLDNSEANLAERFSKITPAIQLARFSKTRVYVSSSGIDFDVVGPMGSIFRLYPQFFRQEYSPLRLFRPSLLSHGNLWLKSENSRLLNYRKLSDFLSDKIGSNEMIEIKLTPGNDWWLRQAGYDASFRNMKEGFDTICRDIEARERRRKNILRGFLNMGEDKRT